MAVPSILMVAPSGSTKLATSFLAPNFSVHSRLRGRAPTEDALENAIIMAGAMPLKNLRGPMPARDFTVSEYTNEAWSMYPI